MGVSIFISLIKSRFGQWVINKMVASAVLYFAYAWAVNKLISKYHLPLRFDIMTLFFIGLIVSIFLYDVFKIGNYILKYTLIAMALFGTGFFALIKFAPKYQVYQTNIFYVAVGISFLLSISSIFNLRKRMFVLKSLSEVDRLGNGDTYEKGRQFEEYVAGLYQQLGYNAVTTTTLRQQGKLPESIQKRGGSGDQGVDVVFYDHIEKQNVIVQCKHYSSDVSNKAVQEIVGAMAMYNAQRAIVVTNQYFTTPAKELALVNGVILVDRDELGRMIDVVAGLKNKAA